MKKSRKIIIVVLIILIVLIIFLIYKKNVKNNDSDSSLLAVSSYSNYGFYDDFKGTAIFNNGSIYTWNMNKFRSSDTKYDLNSIDGLKKFVLNYGRKVKNVSKKDLEQINIFTNNLTNEEVAYDKECRGADMGMEAIKVYNKSKDVFILKESGNCEGNSKSKNAKKLIVLIEKYL